MKDKQDPRSVGDMTSDGITGHTQGVQTRANWITENMGKTVIIIITVIVIFSISVALSSRGGEDDDDLSSQQGAAGQQDR